MKRTPLRRKQRLRQMSDKRREQMELYYDKRESFLKDKFCEFPSEPFACLNRASEVHHRRKRGKYLLDKRTWIPICREHHRWIHDHPNKARKLGVLV